MAKTDIKGRLNGRGVIFAVESGHLIMFHDQKAWDSDAANFYGCSKRSKYFSTDLGVCSAAPERTEIESLLTRWNFVPGYVLEIEGEAAPAVSTQPQSQANAEGALISAIATALNGKIGVNTAELKNELKEELTRYTEQLIKDRLPIEHIIKVADKEPTKIEGVTHEKFDEICALVNMNKCVYLFGPAGSGKTEIAKQVADALGLEYYMTGAVTQEYKLEGFRDAAGHYHDTELYKAVTRGGLFMFDELDSSLAEALILTNSLTANKYLVFGNGERVQAHPNFRIIAAGNTNGAGATEEYIARYQLDASTLNRFIFVDIDYSPAIEKALTKGDEDLYNFIRQTRKAARERRMKIIISYRTIIDIKDLKQVLSLENAIKYVIANKYDSDTIIMLFEALTSYDNKYIKAAKKLAQAMKAAA